MARRALLIGAQYDDLKGVGNDLAVMTEALDRRGFEVTPCEKDNATRDGIMHAYERLIEGTGRDDAVFVYFSGHGGYVRSTGESGRAPDVMQFIVPVDYQSTPKDFRGITSAELSVLQARLTSRTRNVVVALDCCHAAHMSRGLRAKSLRDTAYHDLAAHFERRIADGLRVDLIDPRGNPDAVRIVACAPEQSAYETDRARLGWGGALTDALAKALNEAGTSPVTWSTLIRRVRDLVRWTVISQQRPEAEGPSRRLLFELTVSDPTGSLPVAATGTGRARIEGGPLLGVQVGDEFWIMPADAPGPDPAVRIAQMRITGCEPMAAVGPLVPDWATLPLGARAHRTKAVARATPVHLPEPAPDDLLAAMAGSTLVRPAEPGEPHRIAVRVDEADALTVHDHIGPLHDPRPAGPGTIHQVVRDLERVARAEAMRGLEDDPAWALRTPVSLEWGRIVAGRTEPLISSGATIRLGDAVFIRARNDGDVPVYVSLIDIGVSSKITVLTSLSPSGHLLEPGADYVFGRNDLDNKVTGAQPTWPDGLDRAQARPETILALFTSAPQDVSPLEQAGVRRDARRHASPLEDFFVQVATGGSRDFTAQRGKGVRYSVRRIEFDLVPQ